MSGPTAPVCRGTRGFGDPARPQFADAVSTGNWAVCIRKKHGGMCPSCLTSALYTWERGLCPAAHGNGAIGEWWWSSQNTNP